MKNTTSAIAAAGFGAGGITTFVGAPTWVAAASFATSALLVVADHLVTQFIRVRSSRVDPVRAHRIEQGRRRHGRR